MNIQRVDYQSATAPKDFTQSVHETGFVVLTNHPIKEQDLKKKNGFERMRSAYQAGFRVKNLKPVQFTISNNFSTFVIGVIVLVSCGRLQTICTTSY